MESKISACRITALLMKINEASVVSSSSKVRQAVIEDLESLIAIENCCFKCNKLSSRSFKHFLKSATALVLVTVTENTISGYGIVLFHRGTSLARIYSLAVHPNFRNQALATLLMKKMEKAASEQDKIFIRLEVSKKNKAALQLYQNREYKNTAVITNYYENGETAVRMEKKLSHKVKRPAQCHYYRQTTEFTCGPAALMMAMNSRNSDYEISRSEELNIWRQATTIYMAAGHGGTSPLGLSLAAYDRGFDTEVWMNGEKVPLLKTVRTDHKRDVYTLVHHEFEKQIKSRNIKKHLSKLNLENIELLYSQGGTIVMLISTYQLNRQKIPHWIWIVDIDDHFVYINDPYYSERHFENSDSKHFIPVPKTVFKRMMNFGTNKLTAAVLIKNRSLYTFSEK